MRRIDWMYVLYHSSPIHDSLSSLFSGNFLVIGSTASTILALTWAGAQHPWKSYQVLIPLILGAVGLGVTLVYEFNWAAEPILPRELLWNRTSLSGHLGTFLHGLLFTGVVCE